MAEYQSIFTGQQVDNALSKLRDWINTDGSYPTVTVDGITYAVVWKVLPTSSNQVYGIGLHPTTGRVYQIYNNKGVYSATALDYYVDTKNTAGSSNSDNKLFIVGAAEQSAAGVQTYSNLNAYIKNGLLYSGGAAVLTAHAAEYGKIKVSGGEAKTADSAQDTIEFAAGGNLNVSRAGDKITYSYSTPDALKNPNKLNLKVNSEASNFVEYDGSAAKTVTVKPSTTAGAFVISDGATDKTIQLAGAFTDNDTKNTAGSSNSDSKLFIIGASTQAANPQTYSNSKVYTQNGKLYSNNTEVSVVGHTHSFDTVTNRGEAFLSWGGKNFSGSYGPIDAAMVPELGANRLAFMPADAVTIEYSRDGGSTWTDYGPTDSQKIDLFNGRGSSFTIGKATSGEGNIATNQYQLRVNIYTSAGRVYTALNKFVIYLSTSGTNNNWCTIRARKQSDYTAGNDTWTTFADKISVSGWSGYNVINTSGITTYGNTASTQYGHIQFIFGCDTGSTNNSYAGLNISKIFGFGGVGWTTPSTMAKTGHMYTYDSSQNVTFPAGVSAKSFTENGKTLSDTYIAKSALTTKGDMIYASGKNTPARLAIGSTGQFLSVADGIPKWVNNPNTDTDKKTASSNNDAKLFLIGAAVQSADGQTTYSNSKVYTQNGILYSDSKAVLTGHATHIVTINSGKKSDNSTDISSNSGTATSGNMTVTLGDSGVAAGTYRSVTVNSKGIVVAGDQTDTDYDTKNTAGSTNSTSTLYLVGAGVQAANPQTYSNSKVYMTDGTLYLTKATDLSGTANNHPALIVGGTDTTAHLEIDANEIHAKASGNTVGPLYLNHEGGYTCLSGEKTYSDGTYLYSNSTKVSVDGHTHEVSDITDIYKQEYNLGYYDTITENSDGTYTITRQTGYHNISNGLIEHGYYRTTQGGHGEYGDDVGIHNLPIVSEQKSFINNLLAVRDTGEIYSGSIGIAITRDGGCWMNLGDNYTTKNQYVEYLSKNNIYIQYKLATSYTEKVEANHYARYNERFILEHNKSEAERSANLFDANNVEYGSIDENGTNMNSSHARARSVYIHVLPNTYYSISANNSSLLIYELYQYDSNKSYIAPYIDILKDTYTFLTKNNTYYIRILFRNTSNTDFNLDILSRVMLNEGSVALPYQPYEGKVVHEKGLGDYLTLSGGTLTGHLCFKEISNGTFPVTSSGIVWNGSTDGASIFYRLDASDAGRLVFQTKDDSNCNFVWNNTVSGNGDVMTLTGNGNLTVKGDITSKGNKVALDKDVVKLTGNQTISGTNTFSGKIINTYLQHGIIDTHPENNGTILGYYTNDWAYLLKRGYSCAARNVTQNTTIEPDECWFDTSPSYDYLSLTSTSDVVEIIIKGPAMWWTTRGGIGFGNPNWRAKNVKIEVGYTATNTGTASNPDKDIVWVTRINVTNQGNGIVFGNINGPTEAEGGHQASIFSYMRLTLTNWNNTTPRIAQIFTFNVGSIGMHNAFLSKGGGNFYGSIWPTPSNTYDLGNNANRWASVHATTFYENGTSLVSKYLGINGTAKTANYLLSPTTSGLEDTNISDKENTNKAKLRIDLATSATTSNKPSNDGFIYTNIWDIKNSKNNNTQLYIPNGYHITNGRRLSVRGCKDDTWQTTWKELAYYSDLDNYTKKTITIPDNTSLDTVTESGFYRLSMNPNFPHAQMIVSRGADTIAQMAFPYDTTRMYVRTGNPFNTSGGLWHDWKQVEFKDHTHTSINTAFVFNNNDMPEGSANLSATTTAHKLTFYRNGLSVPFQMDTANDGGILRCRGNSESNVIFELATWDDSGAGETIQFNYYPTNSQATPTYSVTVPKKTGTILLTTDSSSAGNAAADKVVARNDAGSIQTEKLAVSSGTTTKATMQYNSTEDCIEFIFA